MAKDYKVQRFCWFDTAIMDEGKLATLWKYKRAIEGHKLVLSKVDVIANIRDDTAGAGNTITIQVYDGHRWSVWGAYPNIFDQSTLGIMMLGHYESGASIGLQNWECKEATISCGITTVDGNLPFAVILWFYEVPMSKEETYEYAAKQPRYKYRHGSATTLDRFEAP
ncbi:unnamed protein product [marine sediment metagenome]|uniref:Uncharacterized protein n=1 Tax=marine sediment metagenome TaxID=412755 RepID=X0ZA91_9ZZZZ